MAPVTQLLKWLLLYGTLCAINNISFNFYSTPHWFVVGNNAWPLVKGRVAYILICMYTDEHYFKSIRFLSRPEFASAAWWPANCSTLDTTKRLLVPTDMVRIRPTITLVLLGVLLCAGHSQPSSVDYTSGLFTQNILFLYDHFVAVDVSSTTMRTERDQSPPTAWWDPLVSRLPNRF